jgi:hypothetical protein
LYYRKLEKEKSKALKYKYGEFETTMDIADIMKDEMS